MQTWKAKPPVAQSFGVLLFDGFSNHCLANLIEPLRASNMLSGSELYRWSFLTLDGGAATSSSGLRVDPHDRLSRSDGDILAVMPSYGFRDHAGWKTRNALTSASTRFSVLAGLDTGSWLLAEAGLLDGYQATIHWQELTAFSERFDQIDTVRERYVIGPNRITCSGAMAAFDLTLKMIGDRHGQVLSLEVAQLFMSRGDTSDNQPVGRRSTGLVNRAVEMMQANIEEPLSISKLADNIGTTQKKLEGQIQLALGKTPQQIYRRLRLNVARKLVVESELPIVEIALRCGYQNASAMTRAFKAEFGSPPRGLRLK
jgi:transcriptional regulator GlxA family with amidase domain